ncbi:MAG TPA: MlaD family protein, partial [Marmoricola sp.]|nr:MlaD family protein [Marmoricola sp.]
MNAVSSLGHRLRLGIFAVLAVGLVIVAGTEYVGIPQRYLGQSYEVRVNLPESGGIFPNAEVTVRGVPVGRVKSLQLTPDGVQASLRINKGVKIPADTLVKISDL